MGCSISGFPVFHCLPEFAQIMSIEPISSSAASFSFCLQSCPASKSFPMSWLFTSGGQSIGVSASVHEYSGLISFRIDWFDLLAVQGTLKSLIQHHRSKASINSLVLSLLYSPTLTFVHDYWKHHSFDYVSLSL